ncbi:hypothetical protein RQP46_003821 [Phenoliferia psychrophenolica]
MKRETTYYLGINRNKKSLTLNLKAPEGLALALKLASKADIILENQISGKLEKLGLGYDAVQALEPDIIYCSITGFGQTGPYREAPGYDAIIGGEAGLVFASQTGEGVYIDVSMFDAQLVAMSNVSSAWLNAGVEVVRVGTGHTNVAPYQVFETKDGYIMIGIANDIQFQRFSAELGQDWATRSQYRTNADRLANVTALLKDIGGVLKLQTTAELSATFRGKGFPFGSVNNMEQAFNHPQTKARKMVVDL